MSTALRDQPARDRFIHELDQNFCVSAGAGVGKTSAIVQRVAQLAWREPAALARLVVVTYTKAAAEELRVRARALVLEQLRASAHRRQNLLAELRRAFFGTIHSFCLKLVREQGRFLGLSQNVELLDETEQPKLWTRFCESSALDALPLPAELLRLVLRFLSFQELLTLAEKMTPDEAEKILAEDQEESAPDVTFAQSLAAPGTRSPEKTAEHQAALRAWLAEFQSSADFLKLPEFATGSGAFKQAFAAELGALARWLGRATARLAAQIALGFRDFRRAEHRMTYADQIAWARQLIADPRLLDRLRARELIVILDEAQDTDADMFSILSELTRPRGAPRGAWPWQQAAHGPEPGRFCFVGDEQQAIYDREDLGTYRAYLDAFAARRGGEPLEFSVTMRCPQRVIATVNATFFAGARLRQTHLEFRELFAKPAAENGAVWRLPLAPLAEEKQIDALFDAECQQVAAWLFEEQPAGLGVHCWSEIALLCPRHNWLARAREIFTRAEIPCRLLAEKKTQLELAACSWPAALFYTLVHPWDRFELLGVLREIFAVSDVELADAHAANQPLTLFSGQSLSPRLDAALTLLRRLRDARPGDGTGTLSRFVDRVLAETQLAARLEASGESAAGLDSFRYRALEAECAGVALAEWVDDLCARLERSAEGSAEIADELQILTCQKAKGLEWPVVIALGLGRKIGEKSSGFPRVQTEEGKVVVHLCKATLNAEWESQRLRQTAEELQRVFYVTLTRAQALLILPDSADLYRTMKASFFELCRWSELDLAKVWESPSRLVSRGSEEKLTRPTTHFELEPAVLAQAIENSRKIPRRILPSELGHDTRGELPEGEPVTEIGGKDYGTWWHATMQNFPWRAEEKTRRTYLQTALASVTETFRPRAAQELQKSEKFRAELQTAGRLFLPEIPFSHARTPGEWMEGVIDLVVVTHTEELWIIDWKTDRQFLEEPAEAFAERLRAAYGAQLAAYGEVLQRGMGRAVARLILYATELGSIVR